MHRYIFLLGHQPHVSTAEIEAVFGLFGITPADMKTLSSKLVVDIESPLDVSMLIERLGGTVAILERVPVSGALGHTKDLVETIAAYLDTIFLDGKITFSFHGGDRTGLAIKKCLKAQGRSVRFVQPKNTATILHNKLVEKQSDVRIIGGELFVTRAIQPIESFGARDYDRPGVDSKSGMLPPKLARMMINLSGVSHEQHTLLDPFCGSGTVLMEAAVVGFEHIIGTDLSEKAILDSKKNMQWLEEDHGVAVTHCTIVTSDARAVSKQLEHKRVDVIVSEPFMGKPLRGNESKTDLHHQSVELGSLFVDAFGEFAKFMKPGSVVVFIIPQFRYRDGWVMIDCMKGILAQGFRVVPFSAEDDSLLYWREGQHVGRRIWRFEKI